MAGLLIFPVQALAGHYPAPPLYPSFSSQKAFAYTVFAPKGTMNVAGASLNNGGAVAGTYIGHVISGFLRTPNGKITSVRPFTDVDSNVEAFVTSLNDKDIVAGYVIGPINPQLMADFEQKRDGTVTTLKASATALDVYINDANTVAGTCCDTNKPSEGFVQTSGGTLTKIRIGKSATSVDGLNGGDSIVGHYFDSKLWGDAGFIRSPDGAITKFRAGDGATEPAAINDKGVVAGICTVGGQQEIFIRAASGSITTVAVDGAASGLTVSGLNVTGEIVGSFLDGNNRNHSFARAPSGALTAIDVPGEKYETFVSGINDRGVITGVIRKPNNKWAFFIGKP